MRIDSADKKSKLLSFQSGSGRIGAGESMPRNPILDVPLTTVIRAEIALPLQQVLHLQTIGSLLQAWRNPKNHKSIEQVFESPAQARHAIAVCATWLGVQSVPSANVISAWWHHDDRQALNA
jgi:hypothetical protein